MSGSAVDESKVYRVRHAKCRLQHPSGGIWVIKYIATTSRVRGHLQEATHRSLQGCLPNTAYTLKAVAYGDSTAMTTKTVTVTTPHEYKEPAIACRLHRKRTSRDV